jgi:carboxymethylenebutenolidase
MTHPVDARWTTLSTPAGTIDAYLALPPAGRGPGLLMFQEIFGVNEHIRAVAEQYALAGFVVLAPDVFWRQERRVELGYEGADWQRAVALRQGLAAADKTADLVTDIGACVAALRGLDEVAGARVGTIGWCLGGRLAYTAAALSGVDAAVAYYGGGIHDALHLASGIDCPIQFHYAGQDDHIPPAAVDRVRAAVAGKAAEVHVYPGSRHGFNCWARASYHPPSAALAHGRAVEFLARTLFGPRA